MELCVSTLHFLTVIVKCVPGEVHLGYVMTSYGTLYFHFACGISGGHVSYIL